MESLLPASPGEDSKNENPAAEKGGEEAAAREEDMDEGGGGKGRANSDSGEASD